MIWTALKVLRRGQILRHAGTWKTVSAATTALAVVLPDALSLTCDVTSVCLQLSNSEVNQLATGIAQLGCGLFVMWTIFGTSEKVGF